MPMMHIMCSASYKIAKLILRARYDRMDWRQGDAKQKENYKKYINGGEWVNLSKGSFRKNEPVLTAALYEAVEHNSWRSWHF